MEYLVTWSEGEEVQYLFTNDEELTLLLETAAEKNIIYTKIE
jgi:hypothetical protein